jgi:hypothetical protein
MSTPFEIFLLELAKVMHFSTLAPDVHGACLIIMKEGNVPLLFEFDDQLVPNTILLSSLIGAVPISHRADVYEALLIGNQRIEETLSVKPDEDLFFAHRRFHPAIQAPELEKLLVFFLETVKTWRTKIEEIIKQPTRTEKILPHPSSIQVFPYKA